MKTTKRLFIFLMLFLCLFLFASCDSKNEEKEEEQNSGITKTQEKYMIKEEMNSFYFFWETQNTNELLKGCGLIPDRYPSNGLASIASVGFGLASFVVGVKNGWITKDEGYERCLLTLSHIPSLEKFHGFYYHFYSEKLGTVSSGSEISTIDTALFISGALVAGEYFKGEVEQKALEIYDEIEWDYFVNPSKNFYMAYNTTTNKFEGTWNYYAEQLVMYFLGAGSTTHPIGKDVYDNFTKFRSSYKGDQFITSWFGSIFTYQFSHAFVDFRNILDPNGIDWFQNSVDATIANYNYCIDKSSTFMTYGPKAWGLTACDTPTGYSGLLGSLPNGNNLINVKNDGTVAPCGALGSIVFWPEKVLPTLVNYYTMLNGQLVGDYGLFDAFNFENRVWVASSVIGIDKGITVLMIENYRSGLIWDLFMNLDLMDRAIEVLQFTQK